MATSETYPTPVPKQRRGPFFDYFLFPWVGGSILLLLVLLALDPASFGSNLAVGVVMSGVWAFWCFVFYLVYSGRDRIGFLRMLH